MIEFGPKSSRLTSLTTGLLLGLLSLPNARTSAEEVKNEGQTPTATNTVSDLESLRLLRERNLEFTTQRASLGRELRSQSAALRAISTNAVTEENSLSQLSLGTTALSQGVFDVEQAGQRIVRYEFESHSRALHAAFLTMHEEKIQQLRVLYPQGGEAALISDRLQVIAFMNSIPTEGVGQKEKEAFEAFRNSFNEKIQNIQQGTAEREALHSAAESARNLTFNSALTANFVKMGIQALGEFAKSKAIADSVELVERLTKEKYQEVFKNLSVSDALQCVNQSINNTGGKWLENNVNMCTLSPQAISETPMEFLRNSCPNWSISFSAELQQCVDKRMKELEEEKKSGGSGYFKEGGDGLRRGPSQDSGPRETPTKSEPRSIEKPSKPGRGWG